MTERLNITETEYRGLQLPSYSLLKRIDESGPWALKYTKKYDSEAIDFGSLLDCKLITAHEFDNKFYFDATEKPTGQLLELAEYILKDETNSVDYYYKNNSAVQGVSEALSLFGSTKNYDKRVEKFNDNTFWNYLQVKIDSIGKTIFTPDTLSECSEAEVIIKSHLNTARFFKQSKDIEYLYQVMIVTEINGVQVKVMLDIVEVNHSNKTITPYDLKATEMHQLAFKNHFKKMKYYLQGSLYKVALGNYIKECLGLDYTLEDFKFIVWSRSDKYPFIWNMGYEWHLKGLDGFNNIFGEHEKGVYELLDDYMFYSQNPDVKVDRSIVENNILEL